MKISESLFILLIAFVSVAHAQDESRYENIVELPDTLGFVNIKQGWQHNQSNAGFMQERFAVSELRKDFSLLDSVGGRGIYLYSDDAEEGEGVRAFLVTYEVSDTAHGTWVSTELGGYLQSFEMVRDGEEAVVELRYTDQNEGSNGSSEFEMSTFLNIGNYPVPIAKVVRKIWETSHGVYDPSCKDYRFYSIEFGRDVYLSGSKLHVRKGKYKHSGNFKECEVTNRSVEIPGGVFTIADGSFVRLH